MKHKLIQQISLIGMILVSNLSVISAKPEKGLKIIYNGKSSIVTAIDKRQVKREDTIKLKSGNNYLVKNIYIADPSAHVFNGKIYVYPSHDIESGIKENDNGDHFDMR